MSDSSGLIISEIYSKELLNRATKECFFSRFIEESQPLTRKQKVINNARYYKDRVCDAWQVLIGKAGITYD